MAWSGVHAVRFRISQLLWVLHEFAAQSGFRKVCTNMSVKWWKNLGNTLSRWFFLEQFLCAWLWEQSWLVQSKGRYGHHCRMGGGDVAGTGCVLQYEHPLCSHRCSFVRLPADLNAALLLRHSEPTRSGNCTPGKNLRWRTESAQPRRSLRTAELRIVFH